MSTISSFADILRDWEKLLSAAADNAEDLAAVADLRANLQQHLDATRALKARQDSAGAIWRSACVRG